MAEFDNLFEQVRALHRETGHVLGGVGERELEALRSAGLESALLSQLAPRLAAARTAAAEYVATYDQLKARGVIP